MNFDPTRPLSDADAPAAIESARRMQVQEAAAARRDRAWGATITYSPKVFLPLTNLCPDRCRYCAFRRSPGDPGAWTMTPEEIDRTCALARKSGCIEALFCLGDRPERAWNDYRDQLAEWGHESTAEYLETAGEIALRHGLLPHTNAGLLTGGEMGRLRRVNVSLGLMLEATSQRLCGTGMPHERAPTKRPERRIAMLESAGRLGIPMTTGILVGIGETMAERLEALVVLRDLHRRHGHIQEVIVQNFRAVDGTPMAHAPEPSLEDLLHTVALARLVLDDDVGIQAPPNLTPTGIAPLIAAGINDLGGISPVTPDYVNPGHPWPHLDDLADQCRDVGFSLRPRLPIYPRHIGRTDGLHPRLLPMVEHASHYTTPTHHRPVSELVR